MSVQTLSVGSLEPLIAQSEGHYDLHSAVVLLDQQSLRLTF